MYRQETSSTHETTYSEFEHVFDENHIGRLMHVKHPVIKLCQEQIDRLKFGAISFEEELARIRDKRQNIPDRDSNPVLPAIGSIFCYEIDALVHVATEAGLVYSSVSYTNA
ncbi:unnamed protein product [Timema podura]|uniref:Uncharacterized protein n=1 Tax=Timema podura TaxID=61482 RepID=A0ABN7NYU5_TIMPD|nr:unnamed protein product [Timema podura]